MQNGNDPHLQEPVEAEAFLPNRVVPLIVALVAGVLLAWNHYAVVNSGNVNLCVLLLGPLFLVLGIGGWIDPRIAWSIGPRSRDFPLWTRLTGGILVVASLGLSAYLALGMYRLQGQESAVVPPGGNQVTSKYHVGEVWSYKTRPQDVGSSFTIVKVEPGTKLGTIVHISVQGLKLKNARVPGGITRVFPHLPMAETAIDQSVVKLLAANANLPDYEAGYNEWRKAFDANTGGIFTIPVADCMDVAEKSLAGRE